VTTLPDTPFMWELSDPMQLRGRTVGVALPVGEYTTLAVEGAAKLTVPPDKRLECEQFALWKDNRGVALYLLPWEVPGNRLWALRFRPLRSGLYEVPIDADGQRLLVTLRATGPLPEPDIGFGFYMGGIPYPENWRLYARHMAQHRCNSVNMGEYAAPDDSGEGFAWWMDAAIEEGLAHRDIPWGVTGAREPLEDKLAKSKYPRRWPELVPSAFEEPNAEQSDRVRAETQQWHLFGYRTHSPVWSYSTGYFGGALDVFQMLARGFHRCRHAECAALEAEAWSFIVGLRGSNAPLHRFAWGAWAWAAEPRVLFTWAYMHNDGLSRLDAQHRMWPWEQLPVPLQAIPHSHVLAAPEGPVDTVGLEGYREGAVDFMALRRLEVLCGSTPDSETNQKARDLLGTVMRESSGRFYPRGEPFAGWGHQEDRDQYESVDKDLPSCQQLPTMRTAALQFIQELGGEVAEGDPVPNPVRPERAPWLTAAQSKIGRPRLTRTGCG